MNFPINKQKNTSKEKDMAVEVHFSRSSTPFFWEERKSISKEKLKEFVESDFYLEYMDRLNDILDKNGWYISYKTSLSLEIKKKK